MSKAINISSSAQLKELLPASKAVLVSFYSPTPEGAELDELYEQLAHAYTKPAEIAFLKVNADALREVADEYNIRIVPAFILFLDGKAAEKAEGRDRAKLQSLLQKLLQKFKEAKSGDKGEASGSGSGSAGGWRGADLPRGYGDISHQAELQRCELLNVDPDGGGVRVLFDSSKPSTLSGGKATSKDWVESDTDEQLMLYVPFQGMLKLHTLQITSLPPQDEDDDDDETPMRPRKIKLFINKAHNLDFDEAEDMAATQVIELSEKDWNDQGTANIPLRYVKFQNITSLVLFVVDGDGEGEKVRLDRVRLIGEAGEKREMGKLEKIGEGSE